LRIEKKTAYTIRPETKWSINV